MDYIHYRSESMSYTLSFHGRTEQHFYIPNRIFDYFNDEFDYREVANSSELTVNNRRSACSEFIPREVSSRKKMLTRKEIAEIVQYCKENGVTYKSRLKEIGISEWRFYESKRKYAEAQASERESGEFLQLVRGNDSFPEPVLTNRKAGRGRKPVYESGPMSIEMRTQTGTVLRIQGNLDATMIQAIIQASSSHV